MTAEQAAEIVNRSGTHLCEPSGLPPHKGGDMRISRAELDRFIATRQMVGVEPKR